MVYTGDRGTSVQTGTFTFSSRSTASTIYSAKISNI